MSPLLLLGAFLAAGAGAAGAWFATPRAARVLGFGGASLASALVAAFGAQALVAGTAQDLVHVATGIAGASVDLRVDPLSSIFLILLGIGGAASSLYAIGYADRVDTTLRPAAQATLLSGFLASMALVFLADGVLPFLFAWEAMTVLSYFLVVSQDEDDETQDAANAYLVMAHLGTACLLVAFVALAGAAGGSLAFEDMRAHARSAPDAIKSVALVAALAGFGTKAGLVPLHAWLPRAHPAAPSHVSALMSGVMLKTAVYMMIRVALDFLSPGPLWWGIMLLAVGGVTTFVGILYATAENDIKRLLAYSSVENLGVIFMGLGLAVLFVSLGEPALATLPLVAAVLHSLNHMTFKTLLFLGAGSVHHATGTREIDKLGGLVHKMPWTAGTFLIAALAISALPPLNGFVSEWLLFQALLVGVTIPQTPLLLQIVLPVGASLFALAGAISVVCYVKAFGVTFLATPRSSEAEHAHESPRTMIVGMVALAAGIVLLAALAGGVIGTLVTALAPDVHAPAGTRLVTSGVVIQSLTQLKASMSPTIVFLVVVLFALATFLATRVLGSKARARREETWLCGHRTVTPRMEYTGTAYSEATRMFFSGLYGPQRSIERTEAAPTVTKRVRYASRTTYYVERYLYSPAARLVMLVSARFRVIQAGSIHAYLTYIFATLIVVLLWVTRG